MSTQRPWFPIAGAISGSLTLPLLRNGPLPLPLRGRGPGALALAPARAGEREGPGPKGREGEGPARRGLVETRRRPASGTRRTQRRAEDAEGEAAVRKPSFDPRPCRSSAFNHQDHQGRQGTPSPSKGEGRGGGDHRDVRHQRRPGRPAAMAKSCSSPPAGMSENSAPSIGQAALGLRRTLGDLGVLGGRERPRRAPAPHAWRRTRHGRHPLPGPPPSRGGRDA